MNLYTISPYLIRIERGTLPKFRRQKCYLSADNDDMCQPWI